MCSRPCWADRGLSELCCEGGFRVDEGRVEVPGVCAVMTYRLAIKEFSSSYYIGETLLFIVYTHYG